MDKIVVVGAREHNLKNITVEIPRNQFVVITGLSGSGKSSLAFDTIFAEGQRRYVESLSAYARQFLGQLEKPDVDRIEGLSPAVSIDQKGVSRNPRSTVGTVTEVYDYLRLLFARIGTPHCPQCGRVVHKQSAQEICHAVQQLPAGSRLLLLAPLIQARKGTHHTILEDIRKAGYQRMRIDGRVYDVEDSVELDRYKMHTIEAVVDRLILPAEHTHDEFLTRLTDSVETALKLGEGLLTVTVLGRDGEPDHDLIYSEHFACPTCGISLPNFEPRSFSFNSPHGACPTCQGLGVRLEFDPQLIIPDPQLSLTAGAIDVMEWRNSVSDEGYYWQMLKAAAKAYHINLDKPVADLPAEQLQIVLYGTSGAKVGVNYTTRDGRSTNWQTSFEGVIGNLERRYKETNSEEIRSRIEQFMSQKPCETCHGKRLRPEALAVTIGTDNIVVVTHWSIQLLLDWVQTVQSGLSERDQVVARPILKEITARLQFLVNVGLAYLTLDRSAASLSGGEAQRIRLATQIGSQLTGVLYVLDEPSIGLHQRDNARLIGTLQALRDLGNTLLVVEHDDETMRAADWIIDLGPGAGRYGGEVVAAGTLADILQHPTSLTGQYLSGRRQIPIPAKRRPGNGKSITIVEARANNLKNITVDIPLGQLVCITGVSGSGKSTLLNDILHASLAKTLNGARTQPAEHTTILGVEHLDKIINIDQSPIGRTPRSNPATYVGLFDQIRALFAELPESKIRGYKAGRYSFNIKGGRCEACQGQGQLQIEMQFLADVYVPCEVCKGARYNRETLQIKFKDRTIADLLDTTIDDALQLFENFPVMQRKLQTLQSVGLGYLKIGQPATTLSGGEAQRIKLSKELSKRATGQTFYVLDEPSTGLHAADVQKLVEVLHALVNQGNTVVIIEHNLDIIKTADWVIDLGPEGGNGGGEVVAVGAPDTLAANPASYTGQYLRPLLVNQNT
jgi:excinuclease ABC subunit A